MKRLIYYIMVIILFLTSCANATEIPVTINTIIPSAISTNTPLPTATNLPIEVPIHTTIIISATASQTPIPTSVNFSLLTAQVSWRICDGAEEPQYETNLSPDGNWLAVACDPNDPSKFNGTKIVKLGSDVMWDVSFYETYGIFQKNELPPMV